MIPETRGMRAKWRRFIAGVDSHGSTIWRTAWENPAVPGLIVNVCYDFGYRGYTVTHCKSGKRFGGATVRGVFRTLSAAQECAKDLAALRSWNISDDVIWHDPTLMSWAAGIVAVAVDLEAAKRERLATARSA